jgi:hypothetical protein
MKKQEFIFGFEIGRDGIVDIQSTSRASAKLEVIRLFGNVNIKYVGKRRIH